jgi:hypothetical protein
MASELLHTAPLVQKLVASFVAASMPQHVGVDRLNAEVRTLRHA